MLQLVALQLWLLLPRAARAQGDSVSQAPPEIRISEGRSVTLRCNFTTGDPTPYLFWYRQSPNQPPQHILTKSMFDATEEQTPVQGKFSAILDTENKTVPLSIEVSLQDSAVYFCALRLTLRGSRGHAPTKTQRGAVWKYY